MVACFFRAICSGFRLSLLILFSLRVFTLISWLIWAIFGEFPLFSIDLQALSLIVGPFPQCLIHFQWFPSISWVSGGFQLCSVTHHLFWLSLAGCPCSWLSCGYPPWFTMIFRGSGLIIDDFLRCSIIFADLGHTRGDNLPGGFPAHFRFCKILENISFSDFQFPLTKSAHSAIYKILLTFSLRRILSRKTDRLTSKTYFFLGKKSSG